MKIDYADKKVEEGTYTAYVYSLLIHYFNKARSILNIERNLVNISVKDLIEEIMTSIAFILIVAAVMALYIIF